MERILAIDYGRRRVGMAASDALGITAQPLGTHEGTPGEALAAIVRVCHEREIERIVLGEAHEISLDFEPWFDEHATVVDLVPGRMLHWPLNCPHRIVNGDSMNVSFTTEHWTPALRNAYAVNYANGILRSRLGLKNLSQPASGPALHARMAIAGAWKLTGAQKARQHRFKIDFKVDPSAPNSVRDIPAYDLKK